MPSNGQDRLQAVRFVYEAGHSTGVHGHNEHQLVYATRGLLEVETPGSRWVVPPLRALWVPARVPHTVRARIASEMSTLYVDRAVPIPGLDHVTVISVTPLLRELIRHLFATSPAGPARSRVEAVVLDQLSVAPTAPLDVVELRDPRLRAIADELMNDPCDRRTLQDFGRLVGASERTLQRLFAAETGATFGRWRTQLRLQHGVTLLGLGHSVGTAALRSGYREPSAFIAAFRAVFGTTPARYFEAEDGDRRPRPSPKACEIGPARVQG